MATVILSAYARRNLREIGDYIARDDPHRAATFVDKLSQACAELADFPLSYPPAPQAGPNARKRTVGNYLIFYDVHGEEALVTAIVHAARDIGRIVF